MPVVGEDPHPERPIEADPSEVFLRPAAGAYTDAQEILAPGQAINVSQNGGNVS